MILKYQLTPSSAALLHQLDKKKTKLRGLSPQANYTDRATAACRRSFLVQIFAGRGCCVVSTTNSHGR
jgi:hypothetical protein